MAKGIVYVQKEWLGSLRVLLTLILPGPWDIGVVGLQEMEVIMICYRTRTRA